MIRHVRLRFSLSLVALAIGVAATSSQYWEVLKSTIDSGGRDAENALAMLGTIDDDTARRLIAATLSGTDGTAIEAVASGLSPDQCRTYFNELARTALNPAIQPKGNVISAIERAGTEQALDLLGSIADESNEPASGIAFGVLEHVGTDADPVLQKLAIRGRTPWARETALSILRRTNPHGAIDAFRIGLRDPDNQVRTSAALGLAQLDDPAGKSVLQAAATNKQSDYWTESLVGLAALNDPGAVAEITRTLKGSDEAAKARIVWAIARSGSENLRDLAFRLNLQNHSVFRSMLTEKLLRPSDPNDLAVLQNEAVVDCSQIAGMIALQKLTDAGKATNPPQSIRCGLSSDDPSVRALAVQLALNAPDLPAVLSEHLDSLYPQVQVGALTAIQKLHQVDKLQTVEKYLNSDVSTVSFAAAKALAALDPTRARVIFEKELNSNNRYARLYSAAMLLVLDRQERSRAEKT